MVLIIILTIISDSSVAATALTALVGKTTGTVNVSASNTITGTYDEVLAVYNNTATRQQVRKGGQGHHDCHDLQRSDLLVAPQRKLPHHLLARGAM